MTRGTITIVIILTVAVVAAGFSMLYHYRNQARAQQFWGTTTALLIDKGPAVELLELGQPGEAISADESSSTAETPAAPAEGNPAPAEGNAEAAEAENAEPSAAEANTPPATKAVEFNEIPWVVVQSKDAAKAKGIANLRRALVQDTTFDWSSPPAGKEPVWKFALASNDGKNWVTVLFDFDSRQVALAGGRKTALLDSHANEDFKQFFAEQFNGKPAATPVEKDAGEKPSEEKPADEKAIEAGSEK